MVDFVKLCESVLKEEEVEDQLALLEEQIQRETRFDKAVKSIAARVKQIIDEAATAKLRRNTYATIDERKPDLFKMRQRLERLLNRGRQVAIARLDPKKPFVPFTVEQVDNFIHSKIAEADEYEVLGKLRSNQFGQEYFPDTK